MKLSSIVKHTIVICFASIVFNSTGISYAQADVSEISLKIGMIRNYQEAVGEGAYDAYALFPEVELGGGFFLTHIKWGISLGFWESRVDPNIFRDYFPNNYKSIVVTPRLYYSPNYLFPNGEITTNLFAGISYQVVEESPHFTHDIFGNETNEKTETIFEPIIGAQFGYNFNKQCGVSGEFAYHLMSRNDYEINQVELKLLISYNFL